MKEQVRKDFEKALVQVGHTQQAARRIVKEREGDIGPNGENMYVFVKAPTGDKG